MSMDNVRKFYEELKSNKALCDEIKARSEHLGPEYAKKAFELAVEFGKEKGFDFTIEELVAFEKETQELSPEELEAVNAGFDMNICVAIGFGWGETPWSKCKVIGGGLSCPL